MANKDLSQNIELNVSVNPQSIKKAQDEIDSLSNAADIKVNLSANTKDFMDELRKELGFGANAKIRVGGYSTGKSDTWRQALSDRTERNKVASKMEKLGADWSGVGVEEKVLTSIADSINDSAQTLAKRIGIKFVEDFALTMNEIDFAIPTEDMPKEKLQKVIDDFITDAAGGITISPAMFMAAAEKVYKNNPNISLPGGPVPSLAGAISPTNPFPEGAAVDEEVTRQFNEFLGKAVGNNDAAANAVQALLMNKLKIVFSGIIDAGQQAREATFKNAKVAEGDDAAEGLVRYADNAARAAIALKEMLAGLQQGTTAAYARGIVPGKFESKPEAISDPAQLANILVGDYQDLVTGALMSSLPDPKAVADPIAQVLLNPYILGDKFVSGYEKSVNAAIKRGAKNSANVGDAVAAAPAATPMGPLEKYRPVLGDAIVNQIIKLIGEAGGDVSRISAAFDTEFIQNNATPIYEAGVTIKNSMGEFIDLLKMVQIPSGAANDINFALKQAGAGAQSVGDIKKRGEMLGITPEQMGTGAGDVADIQQYREKLIQLGTLLQALDEVGVQVAGSNIVDADFRMLAKTFDQVNTFLTEAAGIEPIKVPAPTNIVDFKKILGELAKIPNLAPELGVLLQKVIKDGVTKGGTDLGELLAKAIDMQPAIAERYNVQKQGRGFAIDGMQAHVAVADNRASLIVLDFLKQFAQSAELISKGTGVLGATYGGGTAGPYSNKTREQYSSAFGGGFAVNPADRAKAAETLVQETQAQEANNKAVRDGADLAQKRLTDDKEYKQIVSDLTEARGAYNLVAKMESGSVASPQERAALEAYILKLEELGKTSATAKIAADSLRTALDQQSKTSAFIAKRDVKAFGEEKSLEAAQKAYDADATVKEVADKRKAQSGRNYENTATQVERNITGSTNDTTKVIKANTSERVLSIEQEEKARKDASDRIKGIYKEQVEAEKAVQAATKASINQWVTGRYALYDVGNAYQNVSTQLFRVSRRIFDITKSYRDYETAFTSVERAMQLDFSDESGSAKELKDQFIALSETIPVAFEELSRIATLGAQMGIGAKGIVQFTETVAQFAAVTGISADTVAQKFGRIAELTNLDSSDFYKLGSAVTFAGVNAVATESEILTLSESIAAVSNQAGMSTSEVVGLATSLASIGVPAEQARGVFTRVFADIDRAVATGGKKLDAFAATAGMSGESFSAAWGTNGGSYDVLRNLLGGLNGVEDLTKAFDALGIVETREINTLTRLANNLNVVDGAISDSNSSFGEGKFLLDSFGKTTDNLDSKITIFQNNLKSLGEQLGQVFGGTLKDALDVGSGVVKFMKDMANSPVLQFLTIFSSGTVVLTGVLTGMTAVMAKVTAQIYAFRVAMINSANDTGAITGITKQVKQLTSVGGGLIELRDKLLTPSPGVRGEIVPVDYSLASFARGEKAKQAYLLKTQNIFVASSREQADSLQRLILLRQHEIDKVMESSAASGIEAAKMRSKLASEAFYVEVLGNETSMLTANQYAELKNAAAAERTAGVKNGEAAARLKNIQVINAETKAAAGVNSSVMGFGSKFMGFLGAAGIAATILTTVVGIVQGIVTAVNEANKLDLAGSGLTAEALKDTITQDTQAWMDNGDAITTQTVLYEKSVPAANKYAAAVSSLSESLKETYGSQLAMEKATRSQTIAFGSATKELIVNAILANEKIKTLIDKNAEMFNDLASLGYNLSDVVDAVMGDPTKAKAYLDTIENGIKDIDKQIALLRSQQAGDEGLMVSNGAEIDALKQRKTELEALGQAGKEAMAEIEKAITMNKIIEMSKGYAEAFVGLEAKMKNAIKTGKGMAAVLKEVAATAIATSNITDSGTILEINSAKSIDEMIKIIKALQLVEIAAKQADLRMDSFGRRALATGTISIATQYDGTIKSLELLANASSEAADAAAKGSETAADKLKRLISEANAAKSAVFGLNGALRTLGAALKDSASWSQNTEKGAAKLAAVLGVVEQIGNNAGKNFPKAIRELQVFQIVMSDMGAPKNATDLIANAIKKLGGDSTLSAKQIATLRKQFPQLFSTMLAQVKAGAMPFKTLTAYIGEVRNALQSAFDFRYGKQTALDNLNKSWITLKEAATSAADAIKKANEEIAQTTADRTILEYQLGIAEKYNDQRRAASIRAKLAANSTQKSEQEKALADAKDAGSTVLTGDTKAAIDNRAKIRDLVTTYNNYLISLANTGKSAEDLKTEATKLSAEFLAQGKALGFAEKDLQAYTDAFKTDFTTVINGLPTNITLAVDTDPALRAIAEFVAEANAALAGLNFTGVQVAEPTAAEIKAYKAAKTVIADKKATAAKKKTATAQKKAFESKYGTGYAAGGFVSGSGGAKSDSIPAMLSNGEYVVQASSVKAYGVDFLNALNQQRVGFQPVQPSMGGQQQQSGPQMVYLSPEDRALLRSAVDRPVNLYTENQKIASSANAGNVILAQRGAR